MRYSTPPPLGPSSRCTLSLTGGSQKIKGVTILKNSAIRVKSQRQRDLTKIHIAEKGLGMDEPIDRAMLLSMAGVEGVTG